MKLIFAFLFSLFGATVLAQPVISDPNAKQRTLNASFSAVSVSDGIKLYLTEGAQESIAVSASEAKYEDRFKTVVEDGVLRIYFDNDGLNWSRTGRRKLTAYVSFKTLKKLKASGGAEVVLPSPINVEDLSMKFTSGSRFTGKVNAKDLYVTQNSGSEIEISGTAQKIDVDATSGSILKGFDLIVDYCTAKATSGAAIRISINKELAAKANSGGAIRYKGEAVIRDVDVNSGGIVKKA